MFIYDANSIEVDCGRISDLKSQAQCISEPSRISRQASWVYSPTGVPASRIANAPHFPFQSHTAHINMKYHDKPLYVHNTLHFAKSAHFRQVNVKQRARCLGKRDSFTSRSLRWRRENIPDEYRKEIPLNCTFKFTACGHVLFSQPLIRGFIVVSSHPSLFPCLG